MDPGYPRISLPGRLACRPFAGIGQVSSEISDSAARHFVLSRPVSISVIARRPHFTINVWKVPVKSAGALSFCKYRKLYLASTLRNNPRSGPERTSFIRTVFTPAWQASVGINVTFDCLGDLIR